MNKVFFITIIISCILFLTDCKKEDERKELNTITINFAKKPLDFNNLFKSLEVIRFPKDYPLGSIKKIEINKDRFYILTSSGKTRVYCYHLKTGELIKISQMGKGPNEHLSLRDIYLYNNTLNLLDFNKKRILKYSLDGQHIENITFPIYFDKAHQLDKNTFILFKKVKYHDKNEKKVNIYSTTKQKIISSFLDLKKFNEIRDFTQPRTIYSVNDTLRLFQTFSNFIYNINTQEIKPRYLIDYKSLNLPQESIENNNISLREFIEKCKNSQYVWGNNNILENNNYVIYSFKYHSNDFINIYNKKLKKVSSYNSFSKYFLSDQKQIQYDLNFYPISIDNESLYFITNSYFLNKKVEMSQKKEFLKTHNISNLSYDENPIIIKLNFK